MGFHRRVALVSAVALLGLFAFAGASNNTPARSPKLTIEKGLRERIQSAKVDGCGS